MAGPKKRLPPVEYNKIGLFLFYSSGRLYPVNRRYRINYSLIRYFYRSDFAFIILCGSREKEVRIKESIVKYFYVKFPAKGIKKV